MKSWAPSKNPGAKPKRCAPAARRGRRWSRSRRAGIPLVVLSTTGSLCPVPGPINSMPRAAEQLTSGAELVVIDARCSLGGPACGIVVGRRRPIETIAAAPLSAMLELDRCSLAGLEATLLLAAEPTAGERGIPLWQMLAASPEVLKNRAQRLAPQIADCSRVAGVEIQTGFAYLGPGRLTRDRLDDYRILLKPADGDARGLASLARAGEPSVWATIVEGRVCLSLRGMLARDDERLAAVFTAMDARRGGARPSSAAEIARPELSPREPAAVATSGETRDRFAAE